MDYPKFIVSNQKEESISVLWKGQTTRELFNYSEINDLEIWQTFDYWK